MPLHCKGCGQTFPTAEGSGTLCALCVKREQVESGMYGSAEERASAVKAVEVCTQLYRARVLLTLIACRSMDSVKAAGGVTDT